MPLYFWHTHTGPSTYVCDGAAPRLQVSFAPIVPSRVISSQASNPSPRLSVCSFSVLTAPHRWSLQEEGRLLLRCNNCLTSFHTCFYCPCAFHFIDFRPLYDSLFLRWLQWSFGRLNNGPLRSRRNAFPQLLSRGILPEAVVLAGRMSTR